MGNWDTKITSNDTFQDVYRAYFALYNDGVEVAIITKRIESDFSDNFQDYDDRNSSLFGLALAQWESKSLDPKLFDQIKQIIETESDLELWKESGGNDKTLTARRKALEKFLVQLCKERDTAKRRYKGKFHFEKINLVTALAPDNFKSFGVNEEYVNNVYTQTSGLMLWKDGGGSIFYFTGQGMSISAKWLDSSTMEVLHDKRIVFEMKKDSSSYFTDTVKVLYKEIA